MWIYFIAGTSLILALGLMFFLAKNIKEGKKTVVISAIAIAFVIVGLTVGLLIANKDIPITDILLFDAIALLIYSAILLCIYFVQKNKPTEKRVVSTRQVALLGIIVGIASVLMLMGFPVIAAAPYLKVELSALVIFMTLLWFDLKTAVFVSLVTNIVHFFMPGSTPLIPFLDEMVNFLATMLFILPTAIFLNRRKLTDSKKTQGVLIFTLVGFASTVVLMVLFNQYINLPLIYKIDMSFKEVIAIFGIFNIIKWGINALVINLTWKRFLLIRPNL